MPTTDPLAADQRFFTLLIQADAAGLGRLLGDDFVLVDVMRGSVIDRAAFLAAIEAGQVVFESIAPSETRARLYPGAAVVVGRTQMRARFAGTPFTMESRYTHVFIEQHGEWRLVSAQGTQISEA